LIFARCVEFFGADKSVMTPSEISRPGQEKFSCIPSLAIKSHLLEEASLRKCRLCKPHHRLSLGTAKNGVDW